MQKKRYILAIDQGTSGTTALLCDEAGHVAGTAYREVGKIYPQPGWVEQNPQELLYSSLSAAQEVLQKVGVCISSVYGIGIANQRETTLVWERDSGKPVCNAIVWQCRRTAPICEELKQKSLYQSIRKKTGLIIDAYFSATKLRWILDHIPQGQQRARQGKLLFGTVDTWLAWNLTGGAVHITDFSNASRTMLFNIDTMRWDGELLAAMDIPEAVLPEVVSSSQIYCKTASGLFGDSQLVLAAIVGDQQAALFGQACYELGSAKSTYGTGSFVLLNTGSKIIPPQNGLVTTVAWGLDGEVTYALEGSIFITGAAVKWLRDGLGLITHAAESEELARSVPDNDGIYFVPALAGLGAPYWDMYARGTITGLTQSATRGHLVRAALEAIAYQVRDVMDAMRIGSDLQIPVLRVDGGGIANAFLMQFQADILGVPIQLASVSETTALGAAYLAGLAIGLWHSSSEIAQKWRASRTYKPRMPAERREMLYAGWKHAVMQAQAGSGH